MKVGVEAIDGIAEDGSIAQIHLGLIIDAAAKSDIARCIVAESHVLQFHEAAGAGLRPRVRAQPAAKAGRIPREGCVGDGQHGGEAHEAASLGGSIGVEGGIGDREHGGGERGVEPAAEISCRVGAEDGAGDGCFGSAGVLPTNTAPPKLPLLALKRLSPSENVPRSATAPP